MVPVLLRAWRGLWRGCCLWISFAALTPGLAFAEAPLWCSAYECGASGVTGSTYQEAAAAALAKVIAGTGRIAGAMTYGDFGGYVRWSSATYHYTFTGTPPVQNTIQDGDAGNVSPWCKASAGASTYTVQATRVGSLNYNCPIAGTGAPPNPCSAKSGTSSSTYFTRGWLHTPPTKPGSNVWPDAVGFTATPSTACDNGCASTVGAEMQAYSSLEPSANGLYRVSTQNQISYTGSTCSMQPADANNPGKPIQACDGFVGTVNGKPTCVPPSPGAGASSPAFNSGNNGNPASGSDGSKPLSDPGVSPPAGSASGAGSLGGAGAGGNGGGPPNPSDGLPVGTSGGGGSTGTGAVGGGSNTTGTKGENVDGGACEKNPSASGCGGSPAGDASLYTQKSRTMEQVFNDAKTRMSSSPFGSATTAFFTFGGGGSCPTWSGNVPFLNTTITIDQWCSSLAANMLLLVKAALMTVSAFMAFRIAFDN